MRYLPRVNLKEHYEREGLDFHNTAKDLYYINDRSSFIDSLSQIRNPSFFRHRTMQLIQLFFDEITDYPSGGRDERKKRKDTARDLMGIGINVVDSFYRGKEIDYDPICTKLKEYGPSIKSCVHAHLKERHLEGQLDIIQRVGLSIENSAFPKNIDSVVIVANGGFEPGFLVAAILEKDFVLPVRFSNYNNYQNPDRRAKCASLFSGKDVKNHIQNKNVLVVEDLVCSGESLMKVMRYIEDRNPLSVTGISARISEYFLQNYPPHKIYIKDATTHQFTLDRSKGLKKIIYEDRKEISSSLR